MTRVQDRGIPIVVCPTSSFPLTKTCQPWHEHPSCSINPLPSVRVIVAIRAAFGRPSEAAPLDVDALRGASSALLPGLRAGPIPESLGGLKALVVMNLSYNALIGDVDDSRADQLGSLTSCSCLGSKNRLEFDRLERTLRFDELVNFSLRAPASHEGSHLS